MLMCGFISCIHSGWFALLVPHPNISLILHDLVSVFYFFFTPLHPGCRSWRVHLKVSLHLLLLPNFQTWNSLISIQGLSSTVSLPKNHYMEVSKEMRLVPSSFLSAVKIHFMGDFHPNKPRVQMSRFSTVMNEDCTTLRQWQKEEQVQVSKKHLDESLSTLWWVQHQSFDPLWL